VPRGVHRAASRDRSYRANQLRGDQIPRNLVPRISLKPWLRELGSVFPLTSRSATPFSDTYGERLDIFGSRANNPVFDSIGA
jgi:hypothetical protein